MVICHIMCEFCIVDVKLIVFVTDESPVEGMFRSIVLECIEFVLNLNVDILVFALGLATLGLNNPDSAVFLHNYIVSISGINSIISSTLQFSTRHIFSMDSNDT